ncbi:MAG TPA: PAS domain S-box protein [Azospirillum sp.]|nr:PAS domain S-box protein [Azospirillum sp.]
MSEPERDVFPDGILIVDGEWRIADLNDRARILFGTGGDPVGQDVRVVMPQPLADAFRRHAEPALADRRLAAFECLADAVLYSVRVSPIRNGAALAVTDATASRAADEPLRRDEPFRLLFEQAGMGMKRMAPDGRLLDANAKLCAILGYELEDLLRLNAADITHPDDLPAELERVRRLLAGEIDSYAVEKRYVTRSGKPVWVRVTSSLARPADSADVYRISMVEDISARKDAERRLEESHALLDRILETVAEPIYVKDGDGRFLMLNSATARAFGRDRDAMIGKRTADVMPPDFAAKIEAVDRAVMTDGEEVVTEESLPDPTSRDGSKVNLTSKAPLRNAAGEVVGVVGVSRDITDRKAAEDAMRAAKEAAERADQSKSRFLAAASHDLRQPVQSLFLFAEVLRAHVQDPEGTEMLGHLRRALDALKGLLDSLLDVSRLDADVVRPQIAEFPIAELLDHIVATYEPVAAGKGLRLFAVPCSAVVRSDRILLGRVVANLVENAIRYTEQGRVLIDCVPRQGRLHIEIRDTGIGIPPEHLDRVFDEFYQVGNLERDRKQGLGLGLAIVRRISRLLDHPISVTSMPEEGSTFIIEVPRGGERTRGFGEASPAQSPPAGPTIGQGKVALIVDDDALVLMGLQSMLHEWGYKVVIAASTEQALKRIREHRLKPDIVLADYRLRDGRVGTEAILVIRDHVREVVPGVILTGEIGPEPQRDAAVHGLGLIHKPVTPRQLASVLSQDTAATG